MAHDRAAALAHRIALDLTAAGAHRGIVESLEGIPRPEAFAIARGAMSGIAEWLVVTLGAPAAYEAFAQQADKIIAAQAASKGAVNEPKTKREGKKP